MWFWILWVRGWEWWCDFENEILKCEDDVRGFWKWKGVMGSLASFSNRLTCASRKLDSFPKKAKSTLFSKKLNFKTQKIRPWKNLIKTCWETTVIKRLAETNYWGVGFGLELSNCTKTLVSYPITPPPNPSLNSL